MADNQSNVQTSVQQVDLDIDSLFDGAPGADSIVTPTDEIGRATRLNSSHT